MGIFQPVFPTVEVDQQNHKSVRASIHFRNVHGLELVQDFNPTTSHGEHLELPLAIPVNVYVKFVRQPEVGIVLGKHEDVRELPVDAHGSKSPRTIAPTRSPLTWSSLSGRTTVGSRWLLL